MHSTHTVILKSPLGPSPGSHSKQLKRDRRLWIWILGQMGNLHSKDIGRIIFSVHQCFSFQIAVTHILHSHLSG